MSNLLRSIFKAKSFRIINVMGAVRNVMWPKETSYKKHQTILLSIYKECALIMTDSKTKKSIQDGNSLMNWMCIIIPFRNKKEYLRKIISSHINWEELLCIMELLTSDIISAILGKVIINGSNSTMRELDNLIHLISKFNVSVVNIGEDRVKVHIF